MLLSFPPLLFRRARRPRRPAPPPRSRPSSTNLLCRFSNHMQVIWCVPMLLLARRAPARVRARRAPTRCCRQRMSRPRPRRRAAHRRRAPLRIDSGERGGGGGSSIGEELSAYDLLPLLRALLCHPSSFLVLPRYNWIAILVLSVCFVICAIAGAAQSVNSDYSFIVIWTMLLLIAYTAGGTLVVRNVRRAAAAAETHLAPACAAPCAPPQQRNTPFAPSPALRAAPAPQRAVDRLLDRRLLHGLPGASVEARARP